MNIDQEGKDKLARVCESETMSLLTPERVILAALSQYCTSDKLTLQLLLQPSAGC